MMEMKMILILLSMKLGQILNSLDSNTIERMCQFLQRQLRIGLLRKKTSFIRTMKFDLTIKQL